MKIVCLRPKSGFITELRSDTLWGLICWGIRNVYGNKTLETTLETFNNNKPEFQLSSCFPFVTVDNKPKLFFPRPCLPLKSYEKISKNISAKEKIETNIKEKKNRKIGYIEVDSFEKLANKKITLENAIENSFPPGLVSTDITHNTIDRIKGGIVKKNGVRQFFHIDEYLIDNDQKDGKNETGLFFLIKGDSTKVEAALRWFSHVGFGRDRNTGKGHFKINVGEFKLNEPSDFNAVTNLSLYFPSQKNKELELFKIDPLFNYQLEQRQGYLGFLKYRDTEKPVTTMFKEGSVFPAVSGKEIYGENLVVKEKDENAGLFHNVYQYGYGFMVKMKI